MLKRKIEAEIKTWYDIKPKHNALLVMGARQVGKTFSIRRFAEKHYASVIEINFERTPSLRSLFDGDLDGRTLYERLSAAGLGTLIPGQTLLFLDEIQACPRARTALKFLVEDGRLEVIASGSLLGIHFKEDVPSHPVGYEHRLDMHSLDFEEFLWAMGIGESTIKQVRINFENRTAVDSYIHKRLLELFQRYMIVGGMPRVVDIYTKDQNIQDVIIEQRNIVGGYKDDILKYAGNLQLEVAKVFDSIPDHLMERNKRFIMAHVEKDARFRDFKDALAWLRSARVAEFCFNVSAPIIPMGLNAKNNIFKFFMRDTGLLCQMSLGNVQQAILAGDLEVNLGSIIENAIADLLVKRGHKLYYYDVKGRLEIDFLITRDFKVLPIEVKGGKDFRNHHSLDRLLENPAFSIDEGIVLCRGNVEQVEKVSYLPLYMVMFL